MKKSSAAGILFVTSYPPRQCGIATYSKDLVRAINRKFSGTFAIKICALEQGPDERDYPDEVAYTLNTRRWQDYAATAEKINRDPTIDAVFLQHEFGLFSGAYGEDLLFFLYALSKPVQVTCHTVLPEPDRNRRNLVRAISSVATDVVVMTNNAAQILRKDYGVRPEKISVIPHGTHVVPWRNKEKVKRQYGLEGRLVLSTFGLLSANKSIETALDALPSLCREFPETLYLVLGKTHPEVVRGEGEQYRKSLEDKVEALGLQGHVLFINKYLPLNELLGYLQLTDVYLFTSRDPNQAVSGTFAYAGSCGCPVISTRIPHAEEMLDESTGILIDFGRSDQLAAAARRLLGDPGLREAMGRNAFHRSRATGWDNAAIRHARLLSAHTGGPEILVYNLPDISLRHIHRLTDSSGMIQFSDLGRPDKSTGYTLDDNARALISLSLLPRRMGDHSSANLIDIYLNFIKYCQQHDGRFLNYVNDQGLHSGQNQQVNLEDANGRALWALGTFTARSETLHPFFHRRADAVFRKSLPAAEQLTSPRAVSFAIKGLHQYNLKRGEKKITALESRLADRLLEYYNAVYTGGWPWFESKLTYGNSVLPEALLYAYLDTGRSAYRKVARRAFDFLLSKTFRGNMIRVVSNRGWMEKDREAASFGEQPIDVAYTVTALDLFHRVFGDAYYLQHMRTAFEWFLGRNHLGQVIYDEATGGCYDGLEEHNVNLNQGAESTVCYLLARLVMEKHLRNRPSAGIRLLRSEEGPDNGRKQGIDNQKPHKSF